MGLMDQGQIALDPANLFGRRTNQSMDQTVGQMLDPAGLFGDKKGTSILGPSGYAMDQQVSDARFNQPTAPGKQLNLYDPSNPNASILGRQTNMAADYRAGIPGSVKKDSDTLFNNYAGQAKRGLANDIANSRASFNARGLLNSGRRASNEMGLQSNYQSDLAGQRSATNKSLLDTRMNAANTMESNALNSGYQYAGSAPNMGANALYGQGQDQAANIYNSQLQQQIMGNTAKAGGKLAGSIYANKTSAEE